MMGNGSAAPSADTIYDTIIIGSGPAGYTAAIYTSRANLHVLMFQGFESGGQLMITSDVENYPGFEDAILGPDLMDRFEAQARRFGTEMIAADVTRVDFSRRPFTVFTDEGAYRSRSIIISTGASAKWLGLPGEQRLQGRGVSGCATCDGPFFRNKEIAVVGGGDSAMEEALFLTKYASKVHLLHRRDSFRASKIMQERVRKNEKITIHSNVAVEDVLGGQSVEGLVLRDLLTGASETLPVQGFFVAIGHHPNTGIFKGILDTDEVGYLKAYENTMSSVPGVFIAGDVADHRYRQAVTAAGDGCRAAIDAERWMEEQVEPESRETIDPGTWGTAATMLSAETGRD